MPITISDDQDASVTKMQGPIDARGPFRANDMELLKTGQFSDAQLKAGTRVWNVHKAIVCLRSSFLNGVLSDPSKAGEVFKIQHHTQTKVELLLEFIYSGCISTIEDLDLGDCVELARMGKQFDVSGMANYAEEALWDKLTPFLDPKSPLPYPGAMNLDMLKYDFEADFSHAIDEAYGDSGATCRLLLADFVWAARGWLLHDPIINTLNTRYPLFGSHVLTTLTMGPQSSLVKADEKVVTAAKNQANALSYNPFRALTEAPRKAIQIFSPERM